MTKYILSLKYNYEMLFVLVVQQGGVSFEIFISGYLCLESNCKVSLISASRYAEVESFKYPNL